MGEAFILSGGPDGLYNIRLTRDTAKIAARKTAVEESIARIAVLKADVQTRLTAAEAEHLAKALALDDVIVAFQTGSGSPRTTRQDVVNARTAAAVALAAAAALRRSLGLLNMEEESLRKQSLLLAARLLPDDRVGVWCADLSEELSGVVGTLEVNGETSEILVMPLGKAGIGKVQPVLASTPAGSFYNWAVLPGWQKFKPTYRIGTITALDKGANTADVALMEALSSVQGLDINQTAVLSGVPVKYLT
jgi:hypothetical protein